MSIESGSIEMEPEQRAFGFSVDRIGKNSGSSQGAVLTASVAKMEARNFVASGSRVAAL
jgi:hypothetical protein